MRVAILGCGYVANMYRLTLPLHPGLELAGVHDRERSRSETMARLTGTRAYESLDALLADDAPIVLNLTNPREHYETTRALLEAGRHVYTEKPVAMDLGEAKALTALAAERSLHLVSAPCTLMSPAAQTLWRALREGRAGPVRLAYAEMDDGPVPFAPWPRWINEAGTAWPGADEFETGCAVEHAGYVLTWACAMFGPARRVTASTHTLLPEKIEGQYLAPRDDFSVAVIEFASGPVLRLTNGIYAEHDHRLRLFGDEGVLSVDDPRSDDSPVRLARYRTLRRRRYLAKPETLDPVGGAERITAYRGSQTRDFCRVIADMAEAIEAGRAPYVGADLSLHVTELTLACQGIVSDGSPYEVTTSFAPVEPLS